MNISIYSFESKIDREYSEDDIINVSKKGIELPDLFIDFKECTKTFFYSMERGIGKKKYIGARNSCTNPPYMKFFVIGAGYVFIMFSSGSQLYHFANKIRDLGYESFDLS